MIQEICVRNMIKIQFVKILLLIMFFQDYLFTGVNLPLIKFRLVKERVIRRLIGKWKAVFELEKLRNRIIVTMFILFI